MVEHLIPFPYILHENQHTINVSVCKLCYACVKGSIYIYIYKRIVIRLHISKTFVSYCCARDMFWGCFSRNEQFHWLNICHNMRNVYSAPPSLICRYSSSMCDCVCVCMCMFVYTIATATKKYSANHNAARQPIMHNSLCCGGCARRRQPVTMYVYGFWGEMMEYTNRA